MNAIRRLKNWWKVKTGRDDSPLDGETPFWIFSLFFHVALLIALSIFFFDFEKRQQVTVELSSAVPEVIDLPTMVEVAYEDEEDLGANESENFQAIMDMAPAAEEIDDLEMDVEQEVRDVGEIEINEYMPEFDSELDVTSIAVNGVAGAASNNTNGAIDRVTQEILLSLEERKTLVVWMFDQSASLLKQRGEIIRRFENVYNELDQLQADGDEAFQRHSDTPLLSQVVAFGSRNGEMLRKPTDKLTDIVGAIGQIPVDESGKEFVFSAVVATADKYKSWCRVDRRTGDRERNVLFVIVSDECGDDIEQLDAAVSICRKNLIRVYTVGVPAPFGRENTYVKWVDPDPNYDQSVQWAPVRQGPETIRHERVKLHFTEIEEEEELFDSGFGPFGLTRLCYQSGGMYFTVHPNRKTNSKKIPRWATATYSAHLERFFDPDVMRRYRPDYVSVGEYDRNLQSNKSRFALVQAGYESRVRPMAPPVLRFEKLNEAVFANTVSQAQRSAAALEPKIMRLYEILKSGERDRDREITLRWKAGYDLAMGRTLAVMIRAGSYNAMLAQIKMGLKFENADNNTWVLRPADTITTGSQAQKLAAKARMYLERVVKEHPETPWALLAERELKQPIGWKWAETYTKPPEPPRPRPTQVVNNNNNNPPRPPRQAPPPPPKRAPPKL